MKQAIPVTRTGPECDDLGLYAANGDLFIVERLTPRELFIVAANGDVKRVTRDERGAWKDAFAGIQLLPTDEVWTFTTSRATWRGLVGRAGYALMRDGVMIANIIESMS